MAERSRIARKKDPRKDDRSRGIHRAAQPNWEDNQRCLFQGFLHCLLALRQGGPFALGGQADPFLHDGRHLTGLGRFGGLCIQAQLRT